MHWKIQICFCWIRTKVNLQLQGIREWERERKIKVGKNVCIHSFITAWLILISTVKYTIETYQKKAKMCISIKFIHSLLLLCIYFAIYVVTSRRHHHHRHCRFIDIYNSFRRMFVNQNHFPFFIFLIREFLADFFRFRSFKVLSLRGMRIGLKMIRIGIKMFKFGKF